MLLVPSAWAGSGQAIVPIWGAGSPGFFTAVNVSNITDNPLQVTLTFYGKKGNVIPPSAIGFDNLEPVREWQPP